MEIPNIKQNENGIVLETTSVPIKINGEDKEVKMKKISAGERREVSKRCVKTSLVGSQITGNIDPMEYQMALLSKVIVEAPFPVTIEFISSLPDEVVDYLFTEYNKIGDSSKKKD